MNDSVLYFQGESVLAAAMEYVATERIPTKYVLEGHGEATMKGTVLEGLFSKLTEEEKETLSNLLDKLIDKVQTDQE